MKNIINELTQLNQDLLDDNVNPFEAYRNLREIKDLVEDIMKGAKDQALAQLRHDGGVYEDDSLKVIIQTSAGTWNFKHIPKWGELKAELVGVELSAKEAHKAWERGQTVRDNIGGVVEPALYKAGDETLIFKKK